MDTFKQLNVSINATKISRKVPQIYKNKFKKLYFIGAFISIFGSILLFINLQIFCTLSLYVMVDYNVTS